MRITEFLLARIEEDESSVNNCPTAFLTFPEELTSGKMLDLAGALALASKPRVLAECAAKRVIIKDYSAAAAAQMDIWRSREDIHANRLYSECLLPTLRALATVYADHPDYNPEWQA